MFGQAKKDLMNISLWDYYQQAGDKIGAGALSRIRNLADWQAAQPRLRREFFQSMGLDPLPDYRGAAFRDCGTWPGRGFQMQKIAWQILPDCWNSACIYRPDPMPAARVPAVLYTSGHSGNGTYFSQRHAIMWARRGYICMGFDTIEQNDNPGDHHGLCFQRRPDWVSMGYSAAGGELWNSIRALDVLEKIPGVDPGKIGVTGNSGGGAHSFFLAIADERIKAAAPSCGVVRPKYLVARQHLLSHCDCMCYHNLFQRDPIEFGALVAPRPLLLCFAMEDYLFSMEQYRELHAGIQQVYQLYQSAQNCQLCEYHGPHGYQPESVARINQWFDEHLYGGARPPLPLGELEIPETTTSVFNGAPPTPNRLAQLPERLSPAGAVALPSKPDDWPAIRAAARQTISQRLLMNFDRATRLELRPLGDWLKGTARYRKYTAAYGDNEIWVETLTPVKPSDKIYIGLANAGEHARDVLMRLADLSHHTIAVIVPRFCGFNACTTQAGLLLRAGAYTGMTHFMLMLEDLLLAMPAVLALPEAHKRKVILYGKGDAGVAALYHAILDDGAAGIVLDEIPVSHRQGAYFLNVLRHLDIPHATGLVAPRRLGFLNAKPSLWTSRMYARLGCPENIIEAASAREMLARM